MEMATFYNITEILCVTLFFSKLGRMWSIVDLLTSLTLHDNATIYPRNTFYLVHKTMTYNLEYVESVSNCFTTRERKPDI
jgi:hypothetical protein